MKLIVGLGNPGKQYQSTRHNIGFRVLDELADHLQVDIDKESFHGVYGRYRGPKEDVLLFKPLTFMNLSGQAIREIADYFRIDLSEIVIIFDDMALPPGKIRLRASGSSGGHKGMQNTIDCLQSEEIKRIRVGIGEPTFSAVDYVLGKPTKEEKALIEEAITKAVKAACVFIKEDFHDAMSTFN